MKIMLICAGGMSTSILMKKLKKYSDEHDLGLEEIIARSASDYEDAYKRFDAILLGPQVSYQKNKIAEATKKPVEVIPAYDYAIGNAENIFKLINKLLKK